MPDGRTSRPSIHEGRYAPRAAPFLPTKAEIRMVEAAARMEVRCTPWVVHAGDRCFSRVSAKAMGAAKVRSERTPQRNWGINEDKTHKLVAWRRPLFAQELSSSHTRRAHCGGPRGVVPSHEARVGRARGLTRSRSHVGRRTWRIGGAMLGSPGLSIHALADVAPCRDGCGLWPRDHWC